ncbi:YwqJ-related putative deaminase [Solwaraspora sp. WMMA2101]|uniref:YwqJ-related putative deaminase n=1 Tax=Solwaraspora sp. WMMA2101 TaxID=3404124 RepID=UPI003B9325C1
MAQVRMLPLAAAALLVDGQVHTHTSVRGDVAPQLHPLIRRLLHEVPVAQRERFAGWCAEPVLLSDRLYAVAQRTGQAELSPAAARAALWGARLRLTLVREPDDPAHGTAVAPCRTCQYLLDWAGVEVLR